MKPEILKALFTSLLISISLVLFAENKPVKPNYKAIEANCSNPASPYYYPVIFQKFMAGDSTLSLNEMRHIYYGYQFTDNYNPYGKASIYRDSVKTILNTNEMLTDDLLNQLSGYCDSLLVHDPFDMQVTNLMINVSKALSEIQRSSMYKKRLDCVAMAILSTGKGTSIKSPYWVIAVSHEYDFMNMMGYEFAGKQALIGQTDKMSIKKNDDKIKELYFDVSAALNQLSRSIKK